ncbi:hypothetical protein [Hafnia alvei]
MRSLNALIVIVTVLAFIPLASAKNYPCSGAKGGVAHCTTDGKFVCKDGSISKSKRICTKD